MCTIFLLNKKFTPIFASKANTFQVVLATDSHESYIIFNYADGGIQWLQGDGKTSGLPDAFGQAGFISADRRMFKVRGSGTDQVRNLHRYVTLYSFRLQVLLSFPKVCFANV